jgi:predicted phosphodiesterase
MRYLILSDIHANWEGLEASLAAVDGRYDQILCLGDIVGYGADPNPCVEWVRANCASVVRGNHDKVCCGLDPGEDFNNTALRAARWTQEQLTAENLEYLRGLPQGPAIVAVAGPPVVPGGIPPAPSRRSPPPDSPEVPLDFVLVHGSPLDEDEYLVSGTDAGMAFEHQPYGLTFFGHTHIQGGFIANPPAHDWWGHGSGARIIRMKNGPGIVKNTLELEEGEKYLLNPGSTGQPRDGDSRAGLAIYDAEARVLDYWRIPYDLAVAQARIIAAGLPEVLATRLQFGR